MIYEKLSNKNLTNINPANIDYSTKPANCEIVNSTFYQEIPNGSTPEYIDVFYGNVDGDTFKNCNLDNVKLPYGATIINCSNRLIQGQVDGYDWVLDPVTKQPVEPVNKKYFIINGMSIDPNDIGA